MYFLVGKHSSERLGKIYLRYDIANCKLDLRARSHRLMSIQLLFILLNNGQQSQRAGLAQSVERRSHNPKVASSILAFRNP